MHETLLLDCLDIAARESGGLLQRSIAAAGRSISQSAATAMTGVERGRLSEAADALHRNGRAAVDALPAIVLEEAASPASGAQAGKKAFSFDSLELMAEDQVDDTVELVRGQQAVLAAVEPDLVQLNALVSAVQGHELVQATANPLRPEVWVKALHRALGKAGVPPAVRAVWMQHVCPAAGPELAALYRKISQHMLQQGVAAAAFRISEPKHESRRRADATRFTLRDLKRLVVNASRGDGETQGLTRPGGETMNGMTVPFAMEALKDIGRVDNVVKRMQDRLRGGVWQAEKSGGGEEAVFTPTQTLAREVARHMVENICADPRLLPEVQDVVRALEPALQRLVIHDQRFFADRKHPARELLEDMTQRSLAWSNPDAAGFKEFLEPLQEAVQVLAGMPLQDAEPFDFALQTLRQSWNESEEKARRQRASIAKALIKADARNHAAAFVATDLSGRADIASASPEVRRFLLGSWTHVIAAAKLQAGDAEQDPGGHIALINDIIWSSQPRLAAQNPARLERVAPQLLAGIREQLSRIGASAADIEPFLASLASAHAQAMRGDTAAAPLAASAAESGQAEWHADILPWLSPDEVRESRLLQATDFTPTQGTEPSVPGAAALVKQLAVGDYIDVEVQHTWARWKLAWASPHGTMLMFTDARGQPQSTTAKTLQKMIESSRARSLTNGSVVGNALDAVAQAALDDETQMPV